MLGAIVGDIIGSSREGRKSVLNESKQIVATIKNETRVNIYPPENMMHKRLSFTDDTVLTVATSRALRTGSKFEDEYCKFFDMHSEQNEFYNGPGIGYGQMFMTWAMSNINGCKKGPYGSYGNGSAMRVSPVSFYARGLVDVLNMAYQSSYCTHNDPEAIKGAQAIAACVYLAEKGVSVNDIKIFMANNFDYDINLDENSLIANHVFSPLASVTVPIAIWAALKGPTFEDVMARCLLIGGDTDTIAAMAGAISEHLYGIPKYMKEKALEILERDGPCLYDEYDEFTKEMSYRKAKEAVSEFGEGTNASNPIKRSRRTSIYSTFKSWFF